MRSGNERWPTFFRNRFTLHFFLATRGALRRRSYFLIWARNTKWTGTTTIKLLMRLMLLLRLIFNRELRIFDRLLWLLVVSVDLDVDLRQGAWNPWSSTMAACRRRFSHGRCGDHEELLVAVEKWTSIDKTTKAEPFLCQNTSAILFVCNTKNNIGWKI